MTIRQVATEGFGTGAVPLARPRTLRRAFSLGLYLAILTLLSGLFLGHRVSAELSERSLGLGRSLDAFQELSGKITELSWNGQELALSTLVVEQPVERVLERFTELCNANMGGIGRELAMTAGAGDAGPSLFQRALVRRDLFTDGSGAGVCLAGLGDGGLRGLIARARRFSASWDLTELGQLRYVHVRKVSERTTQVLLVSADGSLRLDALASHEGQDVQGEDVIAGVRPAQSTRILTARAKGTPHRVVAYRSRLSAPDALADYGRQLVAKGYTRTAAATKPVEAPMRDDAKHVLSEAYRHGAEAFVVTSQREEAGSVLSVVQLAELPIPHPGEAPAVGRDVRGRGSLGAARDRAFE